MSTLLDKDISAEAYEIYRAFRKQEGSDYIAKPVSIHLIIDICRQLEPKRVLEMGGGIGTLSMALLKYSHAFIDIYEPNEFCLKKLKENLSGFEGRYHIIESYRILPPAKDYDLVVVDGGHGKSWDGGFNRSVWFYMHYIDSVQVVYFEGYRKLQRFLACKALRKRYMYTLKKFRGEDFKGGTRINCYPSHFGLLKFANYLYWEIREKTAIKNFIRYRWNIIKNVLKNLL